MSHPRSTLRVVAADGITLAVAVSGPADGPPIVLLHGLTSSIAALSAEVAWLAASHRTIAIDARGHGASDKPARFTLDDHIADVLAVMDALAVPRPALLGRSMGSYIALGVAIRAPERTGDLVLVVPRAHATEAGVTRLRRELAADLAGLPPEAQRQVLLSAMMAPATPARKAALLALSAANPVIPLTTEQEAAATAATACFDFRPELGRITARTLVVSGRYDRLNPPEDGAALAAAIPGARFVVLETGHLPALEDRAGYIAAIGSFLGVPVV